MWRENDGPRGGLGPEPGKGESVNNGAFCSRRPGREACGRLLTRRAERVRILSLSRMISAKVIWVSSGRDSCSRIKGDGNRKLDLDEYIVHEPSGERKAASVGLSRLRRASRPGASGSRLRAWRGFV